MCSWLLLDKNNYLKLYNYVYHPIGEVGRVFDPRYRGSISGRVIPKTQKWYLMPPCLTINIIRYRSRIMLINPEKEVAPSSYTPM